jgi:WD40 repeat protein
MQGAVAAFSPDGKWLLTEFTGGNDDLDVRIPPEWKQVALWETATGQVVKTFTEDYRGGESFAFLAFLPDGKRALSAGWGFWCVFEVPDGKVVHDVRVEDKHFFPRDLSRDGKRLLSSGADGRGGGLTLWDIDSGKVTQDYSTPYSILGGRFSPDGKKALISSIPDGFNLGTLRLWDFDKGRETLTLITEEGEGWGGPFAFAPDNRQFVARKKEGLFLWDIAEGRPIRKINYAGSNPMRTLR